MVAMELNGAHVGRLVRMTVFNGRPSTYVFKITKLTHWPNGDVSINTGADPKRYPANTVVELV